MLPNINSSSGECNTILDSKAINSGIKSPMFGAFHIYDLGFKQGENVKVNI